MSGLLLSVKSSCKNSLDSFWQEVKFEFIWRRVIIIFKICTPIMQNVTQAVRYSLLFIFFPPLLGFQCRREKVQTYDTCVIWMRMNYAGVNNWYNGGYIHQVQEVIHWWSCCVCFQPERSWKHFILESAPTLVNPLIFKSFFLRSGHQLHLINLASIRRITEN